MCRRFSVLFRRRLSTYDRTWRIKILSKFVYCSYSGLNTVAIWFNPTKWVLIHRSFDGSASIHRTFDYSVICYLKSFDYSVLPPSIAPSIGHRSFDCCLIHHPLVARAQEIQRKILINEATISVGGENENDADDDDEADDDDDDEEDDVVQTYYCQVRTLDTPGLSPRYQKCDHQNSHRQHRSQSKERWFREGAMDQGAIEGAISHPSHFGLIHCLYHSSLL